MSGNRVFLAENIGIEISVSASVTYMSLMTNTNRVGLIPATGCLTENSLTNYWIV